MFVFVYYFGFICGSRTRYNVNDMQIEMAQLCGNELCCKMCNTTPNTMAPLPRPLSVSLEPGGMVYLLYAPNIHPAPQIRASL